MRTGQLPRPNHNTCAATMVAEPIHPFCTTLFSAAILFMVSVHFVVIVRQIVTM